MPETTTTVTAPDGTNLHVATWTPEADVSFVVVIAHGGAEHVHRYADLADDIGKLGGLVFGPDHRGQGRSEGRPGHIERFEDYAADLRHVIETVRDDLPAEQQPDVIPWFLFGHSMGGLISLHYLLDHADAIPLAGAIISSPLLGLTMKVNPIKVAVGKVAATLFPTLSLPSGIPAEAICRDPEEVKRYSKDENRALVVTAAFFGAMNRGIARVEAQCAKIDVPLLWYVGSGDLICDHTASERVFDSMPDAKERDQTFKIFDGYYHELHNEPGELREPVVAMITGWLQDHVAAAAK